MQVKFGILCTVVGVGLSTFSFDQAATQSYPTRPITIIIPFPAGGNLEIVARPLADRLSSALGKPVIIENRPGGAGGTVGTKAVANANPDGYTLLLTPAAPLVTAPLIYKNLGYDSSKSFIPVATLFSVPHMLVVHPALPVELDGAIGKLRESKSRQDQFGLSWIWNAAPPPWRNVQAGDRCRHSPCSVQGCDAGGYGYSRRAGANLFRLGCALPSSYSGGKTESACGSR